MHIFKTKKEIAKFVEKQKSDNKTVGFVPTMGALHAGHISLVQQAKKQTDIVIVSVFVNPTQFNNADDLQNYPRNFDKDAELLKNNECNAIFYPSVTEIYPTKDNRTFELNGLDNIMEGAFRPGHFNGVAQVVSKLFEIIPADKAFFGLKDFQQVAVIKEMVKNLNIPIEIIPCPIKRESDGLALSSRNLLLSDEHRNSANIIFKTLSGINTNDGIEKIKETVINTINANKLFQVEYFEIVTPNTLQPLIEKPIGTQAIGCIAVWAGNVRLIDNIEINF